MIIGSREICRMPPRHRHRHCYQCGSRGHLLRECPMRASAATQDSPSRRLFSSLGELQDLIVSLIHRVEILEGSVLHAQSQNPGIIPPSPFVPHNSANSNLNTLSPSFPETNLVGVHPGVDTPNPHSPAPSIAPQFSLEDFCRSIRSATHATEANGVQPMEVQGSPTPLAKL